jgi:hypothetical protein
VSGLIVIRSLLHGGCLCLLSVGSFASTAMADWYTFANPTSITIPREGVASPYPASILVSGVSGTLNDFSLSITGFSHNYPNDMAAAVVSPAGTAVLLFSGPGFNQPASNLNFIFNDQAAATLPEEGPLSSGTYKPGLFQWDDAFPAPGPGLNYGFTFAPFLSENPNGTWNLFLFDNQRADGGSVSGGWGLDFSTITATPEPNAFLLSSLALSGILFRRRSRAC